LVAPINVGLRFSNEKVFTVVSIKFLSGAVSKTLLKVNKLCILGI